MQKVMTIAARYLPDADPDPLRDARRLHRPAAQSRRRSAEGRRRGAVHRRVRAGRHWPMRCSSAAASPTAASPPSTRRAAEAAPGVIGVMTHENAPRMKAPSVFDVGGRTLGARRATSRSCRTTASGGTASRSRSSSPRRWSRRNTRRRWSTSATTPSTPRALVRRTARRTRSSRPTVIGEPPEVRIGDAEAALAAADGQRSIRSTARPGTTTTPSSRTRRMALWTADDHLSVFDSTQSRRPVRRDDRRRLRAEAEARGRDRAVRRRRLRRQGRPVAAHGALRRGGRSWSSGRSASRSRANRSTASSAAGRGRNSASRSARIATAALVVAHPDLRHGDAGPRALRRAVHVSRASSLRDGEPVRRSEDRPARRRRQHLDARARRIDRHLRARVGARRTGATRSASIRSSSGG